MTNKYHTKLRNKASAKIFKIASGVLDRNKASKDNVYAPAGTLLLEEYKFILQQQQQQGLIAF